MALTVKAGGYLFRVNPNRHWQLQSSTNDSDWDLVREFNNDILSLETRGNDVIVITNRGKYIVHPQEKQMCEEENLKLKQKNSASISEQLQSDIEAIFRKLKKDLEGVHDEVWDEFNNSKMTWKQRDYELEHRPDALKKKAHDAIAKKIEAAGVPNTEEDFAQLLSMSMSDESSLEGKEIAKAWEKLHVRLVNSQAYETLKDTPRVSSLVYAVEEQKQEREQKREEKRKENFRLLYIGIVVFLCIIAYWGWESYSNHQQQEQWEKDRTERETEKAQEAQQALENVQKTAEVVNSYLEEKDLDGASRALTMCPVSKLGDPFADNEDATALYTSLVSNVVDAYLDKGQKKKAQNLLISCSAKYEFHRSGLSDLFLKLGCDGNYRFEGEEGYDPNTLH